MPADDTTIRPFQVEFPEADLTDPSAHGGDAADAFDLAISSLPGQAPCTCAERAYSANLIYYSNSTKAATSAPGHNPNSSPPKYAPRSDHTVKGRPS